MKIDLTPQEVTFLATLLRRSLDDLRHEIYRTSDAHYKSGLKEDERLMERLIQELGPEVPPPSQIHY